jgi:beta-galactosidase/beta-glucuronidase
MSAFEGYPRPDLRRGAWAPLDGRWDFAFDDDDRGLGDRWWAPDTPAFPLSIKVPFAYQAPLSGVADKGRHDILWYRRGFTLPASLGGGRVFICFGAVDYEAEVWINGREVAIHRGGSSPFDADITPRLVEGENVVVVRAVDRPDCSQPRGKQYWGDAGERIWYTPTSGIWQSVWLERRGRIAIDRFFAVPDIDHDRVELEVELDALPGPGLALSACVSFNGEPAAESSVPVASRVARLSLAIAPGDPADDTRLWAPERPCLYDLELELNSADAPIDRVDGQFGMRKISGRDGRLLLNNKPYEQRLVLDQGYWPDGLLTPPSEEAIIRDIELAKSLGFNGARKHQKIEDPRYLYWADKLGFLVWDELPSAYEFGSDESLRLVEDMAAMVVRDRNHPSVVAWVALNESWGARHIRDDARHQSLAAALRHVALCLDGTRPVSSNDGWEQVETDICGIHDYEESGAALARRLADPATLLAGAPQGRSLYADGHRHGGEPVMLSELGGIAMGDLAPGAWGYNSAAADVDELVARIASLVGAARDSGLLAGFCWTQLTDVEQEANGLAGPDRRTKADPARLRAIFGPR